MKDILNYDHQSRRPASYTARVLSGLIDAGVSILAVNLILLGKEPAWLYNWMLTLNPTLTVLIFFILFRLVTILLFQGTLGMLMFGILFLNADYKRLSLPEKVLAAFFILYRGVGYYDRKM